MNQLLTQDELDELLRGDGAGGAADSAPVPVARPVQPIDLATGVPVAPEPGAVLQPVNRRFARLLQASLSGMVHCPVRVRPGDVRAAAGASYLEALPVSASVNPIAAPSLRGTGLCVIDEELVSTMVGHYFGGDGSLHSRNNGAGHSLTSQRVIDLMLGRALRALARAWRPVGPAQFEVAQRDVETSAAHLAASSTTFAVSSFEIALPEGNGELYLAMPCTMLEPVRTYAAAVTVPDCANAGPGNRPPMLAALEAAHVEVRAILAESSLSLAEVVGLKAGDTLPITLSDSVTVKAGESTLFQGTCGTARGQVVITVSDSTGVAGFDKP